MSNQFINVSEEEGLVWVELARPEVRNAFNPKMIKEITQCFKALSKKKAIRAIVLQGAGKSFCAGADLEWMKDMVKYSLAQNKKDSNVLYEMFEAIAECPHPVVGFVHGSAFGGALGLIACCDIVVAEAATQFCFSEVKLGLVPAVISDFVMRKSTVGLTMPWMMLGKVFDSKEAERMGLVHFSAAGEEAYSQLQGQILDLVGGAGPEAVKDTKKLVLNVQKMSAKKAKSETTKVIAARRVSAEGQAGLNSFLNKSVVPWKKEWKRN